MAHNDYTAESPKNYNEKALCVLVLDTSASMGNRPNKRRDNDAPIDELNRALQDFKRDILEDPSLRQGLEVALIKFNEDVDIIQQPSLIENFEMPILDVSGTTAMVKAVREAIDVVEARKAWYKTTHQMYNRPWIVLITDGIPDDDQDINGLSKEIEMATKNKKQFAFLAIGVEGADMNILNKISSKNMPAMKLKGTRFSSFFRWLSASMGTIIDGNGEASLPNPEEWWERWDLDTD